ncbi:prolyl endopeptidase [Parasteatoda tepidariorum]|uniref:prolyl endopeptidase n=1 Tax=Parasteatoda tepidariorum TaxID=114398 RepID=UPI001C719441|nr:prolyl endopeptidase [Parasteatoda tepidariorum]
MIALLKVCVPVSVYRFHSIFKSVRRINFSFKKSRANMSFIYPDAKRDGTTEDHHGVKVIDPYRWLEDPDADETKEFVKAQNDITVPYLENCPVREKLKERIKSMWNFPKYSCPFKEGENYYYFYNTGLQNQSVLYKQKTLESEPEIFLDPNEMSKEGLISIPFYEFSENGEYLAYGISESGSDWQKIKIKKVSNGEEFPETIEKVKFSALSWTHDNKGFFYSGYPDAENGVDGTETTSLENHKLIYHKIGTDQSQDVVCVEFPEHPKWMTSASVSHCGQYAVCSVAETCKNNMVYICDLKTLPNGISGLLPLKCIIDNMEAEYSYVTNEGTTFTFRTDRKSPMYRLVNIDFNNTSEDNWKDLMPEHPKYVLEWAECVDNDKLFVCYIEDVKSQLHLHDLKTGKFIHNFPLEVGTITGCSGKKKLSEVFFRFVSFLTPGIIYRCELKEDLNHKEFRTIKVEGFDASKFQTTQVFYPSKDGTKIPMFIIHSKDFVRDGTAPAFLYGYGGFNISLLPHFSVTRLIFSQNFKGVLALPNLRGGGEYGESWHSAGKLLNKQNVFDDFQAAAEYLIENKYTNSKKLTINGGSNGGLLIGACINQRPELYGCALAHCGVMDMLRFHKFTIGSAWISDYGNPDEEKNFHNLLKYSPLHNVRVPKDDQVQYPAVLLFTGDHDDRVVPLHTLKLIAELQYRIGKSPKQVNPLLVRVDTECGHGAGKPTAKIIEELTDMYCFIYNSLDLKYYD